MAADRFQVHRLAAVAAAVIAGPAPSTAHAQWFYEEPELLRAYVATYGTDVVLHAEMRWALDGPSSTPVGFDADAAMEIEFHVQDKCFAMPRDGTDDDVDPFTVGVRTNLPGALYVDTWNYASPADPLDASEDVLRECGSGVYAAAALRFYDRYLRDIADSDGNFAVGVHRARLLRRGVLYRITYPLTATLPGTGACLFTSSSSMVGVRIQMLSDVCTPDFPVPFPTDCPFILGAPFCREDVERGFTQFSVAERICAPTRLITAPPAPRDGEIPYEGADCSDGDRDGLFSALSALSDGTWVGMLGTRAIDCDDANTAVPGDSDLECRGALASCGGDGDCTLNVCENDARCGICGEIGMPCCGGLCSASDYVCRLSGICECVDWDADLHAAESCGGDDCDDTDGAVHRSAPEICGNGRDDDCDLTLDNGCPVDCAGTGTMPCGSDTGECVAGVQSCVAGRWGACSGGTGPTMEICDGLDNDCNGTADDGVRLTFYQDLDGDGFAPIGATAVSSCTEPAGYTSRMGDCDDACPICFPMAPETCGDGRDGDCDGAVDDGCVVCGDRSCSAPSESCPSSCGADCCARFDGFSIARSCRSPARGATEVFMGDFTSIEAENVAVDSFAACVAGGSLSLEQSSATYPLGNYSIQARLTFATLPATTAITFHLSYACRDASATVAVIGSTGGEIVRSCTGGLQTITMPATTRPDGTWTATIGLGRSNSRVTIDYAAVSMP